MKKILIMLVFTLTFVLSGYTTMQVGPSSPTITITNRTLISADLYVYNSHNSNVEMYIELYQGTTLIEDWYISNVNGETLHVQPTGNILQENTSYRVEAYVVDSNYFPTDSSLTTRTFTTLSSDNPINPSTPSISLHDSYTTQLEIEYTNNSSHPGILEIEITSTPLPPSYNQTYTLNVSSNENGTYILPSLNNDETYTVRARLLVDYTESGIHTYGISNWTTTYEYDTLALVTNINVNEPLIYPINTTQQTITLEYENLNDHPAMLEINLYNTNTTPITLVYTNSISVTANEKDSFLISGLDYDTTYTLNAYLEVDYIKNGSNFIGTSDTAVNQYSTAGGIYYPDMPDINISIPNMYHTGFDISYLYLNNTFDDISVYENVLYVNVYKGDNNNSPLVYSNNFTPIIGASSVNDYIEVRGLNASTEYYIEIYVELNEPFVEGITNIETLLVETNESQNIINVPPPIINIVDVGRFNIDFNVFNGIGDSYDGNIYVSVYDDSLLIYSDVILSGDLITLEDLDFNTEYSIIAYKIVDIPPEGLSQGYYGISNETIFYQLTNDYPQLTVPSYTLQNNFYNQIVLHVSNPNDIETILNYYVDDTLKKIPLGSYEDKYVYISNLQPNTTYYIELQLESTDYELYRDSDIITVGNITTPLKIVPTIDEQLNGWFINSGFDSNFIRIFLVVIIILFFTILLGILKAPGIVILLVDIILYLLFIAFGIIPIWTIIVASLIMFFSFFIIIKGGGLT